MSRESTDEFVGRQQGYLMLYAAVTQVQQPCFSCSRSARLAGLDGCACLRVLPGLM